MSLVINNKVIENITTNNISVGSYIVNGQQFYDVVVNIEFEYNNKKGYISLNFGKDENNDLNSFVNKLYSFPQFSDSLLEFYDTENYYDSEIESNVDIVLDSINDDKINIQIHVDDEVAKLDFVGLLNITSTVYKEKENKVK